MRTAIGTMNAQDMAAVNQAERTQRVCRWTRIAVVLFVMAAVAALYLAMPR